MSNFHKVARPGSDGLVSISYSDIAGTFPLLLDHALTLINKRTVPNPCSGAGYNNVVTPYTQ